MNKIFRTDWNLDENNNFTGETIFIMKLSKYLFIKTNRTDTNELNQSERQSGPTAFAGLIDLAWIVNAPQIIFWISEHPKWCDVDKDSVFSIFCMGDFSAGFVVW